MKIPKLTQIPEIKILPRIKISIFLPIVAVCAYLGGYGNSFTAAYAAAILHEGAHILCAHFLKVKVSHMTLYPFGVCAKLGSGYIKSSEKEFIIAFSGPFLSLILFWLCSFLTHNHQSTAIQFFADVNLAICAVNLIPALPLDGGRMFKSLLTARYGTIRAYNFTVKFSRIVICFLVLFAVYLLFASDFNFSLILISAFLLQNLSQEQRAISRIALEEILENSQKLALRAAFPAKAFLVKADTRASHILRLLSYDYFCIIHIADQNSRIFRTVTETEVLEALTKKGTGLKFNDI